MPLQYFVFTDELELMDCKTVLGQHAESVLPSVGLSVNCWEVERSGLCRLEARNVDCREREPGADCEHTLAFPPSSLSQDTRQRIECLSNEK